MAIARHTGRAEWQLTIDAGDPARLVAFWSQALGYAVPPPPEGFDSWRAWYLFRAVPESELPADGEVVDRLVDPEGVAPAIWFQAVPEPKAGKNRLHLDLYPAGRSGPAVERREAIDAEVARLVAIGASVLRRYPSDFPGSAQDDPVGYFVVLADPEGNEFCVG